MIIIYREINQWIIFHANIFFIICSINLGVKGRKILEWILRNTHQMRDRLIADTEDDLQKLLYNFHLSCLKYNMKIFINKTKAMTIGKEPLSCKLEIDGRMIEWNLTTWV